MSTRLLVSDGLTQDASIWRFERKYFIDNLSKYSIEMELLHIIPLIEADRLPIPSARDVYIPWQSATHAMWAEHAA